MASSHRPNLPASAGSSSVNTNYFLEMDTIMKELIVKSKKFKNLFEMFELGQGVSIMAGPCSIESYEQMELMAQTLVKNNMRFIRGGAFKPRTSPYDFQGLGLDGLKILDDIRKKYNLLAISEIMDPRDIEDGVKYRHYTDWLSEYAELFFA